jgi:hypothetical protein
VSRTFRNLLPVSEAFIEYTPYEERMEALHRYYGDKSRGKRNAPRRFRKSIARSRDAKDRQILHHGLVNDEDILLTLRKRNANWEYW